MKLSIEVAGRTRTVEIRRAHETEVVAVDGRAVAVDLVRGPRFWSMLLRPADSRLSDAGTDSECVEAGGSQPARSHEVAIAEEPGGTLTVHVNGRAVSVLVAGAGRVGAAPRRRGIVDGADGAQRLTAPMPGRIVKLLVRPGDTVETRQGIVVIEAMKMENELRSPKAGTVTEIKVAEGASVVAGALLAIVE